MNQTNTNNTNYTSDEKEIQDRLDYATEIINILPKDIEETVKKYGAIKRKRGVKSGVGLLQALMLYATAHISIKILSSVTAKLGIAKMTDTAWRNQINKSVIWLSLLLQYAITQIVEPKEVTNLNERNIHLIDASSVVKVGKEGISYRIHMSYNLKKGCMDEIKVTDHHKAENFNHFSIQKNDIYIADAGYGRGPLYEYIVSKEADVIFRITPNNFIVVDKDGIPINLFKILRTTKKTQVEIKCFVKRRKKLLPIRIIIRRIPEEKIEGAIKRKKREATKRQSKIKEETLEYAKWVILATSLDESYSADEILKAYSCRWQILSASFCYAHLFMRNIDLTGNFTSSRVKIFA